MPDHATRGITVLRSGVEQVAARGRSRDRRIQHRPGTGVRHQLHAVLDEGALAMDDIFPNRDAG